MIRGLLVTALVTLLPALVAAHGEHGPAAPLGASATVAGYEIELLSGRGALRPGEQGEVVAKVGRAGSFAPISGGTVLIGFGADGALQEPQAAREVTWAGSYVVTVTPARSGEHRVRVVLAALEGRRFEPALVLEMPITVSGAAGMGAAAWTLVALLGGGALAGLYLVGMRSRLGVASREPVNLLAVPWLRRTLTSRVFQPALQVPLLLLMGVIVVLGFVDVQEGGVNLATKLTWTIWWAGIIFTFVLVGRVWCLACPFGALNEWTSRLAGAARRLPKPFRNISWATGMFVLLTWADEQLGVVRSPQVTAWIVVFFAVFAVAVGLVFERRSFCRYLCPIGGLIGIYSMTAPVELRRKDEAQCRSHRDKECYQGGAGGRGCPMLEFPQALDRNNYCTLCGECLRACSRDNLALRFRAFGKDLWASGRRLLDESYLAVALVGITLVVTAQMLSAWPGLISQLARWLPGWVRGALRPVTYLGMIESGILLVGALVIVPALVYGGARLADRLAGAQGLGSRRTFVTFGYMFVPVGLALHLAHNLAHLLLEGGGIVPAVQRAVATYTPLSLGAPGWMPAPLASEAVVGLLQMGILAGFFVLSLVAGQRIALRVYADPRAARRALAPMAALSFAFTVAGIVLLNQPMGMRHGM
ncbi:MAG: 4Fe-4S binding protein [Candidatus Rokubacteria bacterium]|nr:4Fe-4S binding protein [Candidatus Rokubacteria bacterium]